MKKIFLLLLIIFILLSAFFTFSLHKDKKARKDTIIAGSEPKDFVLGLKDSTIYKLSNFIGKYNIILVFLDSSPYSNRISNIAENNSLKYFLQKNNDIIWFNIIKDSTNKIIIKEKTGKIDLSYKTVCENLPKFYNFKNLPSIVVINKNGIIHLVYSGYSPTIANDILDTLKTIIK